MSKHLSDRTADLLRSYGYKLVSGDVGTSRRVRFSDRNTVETWAHPEGHSVDLYREYPSTKKGRATGAVGLGWKHTHGNKKDKDGKNLVTSQDSIDVRTPPDVIAGFPPNEPIDSHSLLKNHLSKVHGGPADATMYEPRKKYSDWDEQTRADSLIKQMLEAINGGFFGDGSSKKTSPISKSARRRKAKYRDEEGSSIKLRKRQSSRAARKSNKAKNVEIEEGAEEFKICTDCRSHHGIGNHSEFDQVFEPERWKARDAEIKAATAQHSRNGIRFIATGDMDDEFSSRPCEWCGDRRAGERYIAYVDTFKPRT